MKVAGEIEVAVVSGNSQKLFRLKHDTSEQRTSASGVVYSKSGEPILSSHHRFDR